MTDGIQVRAVEIDADTVNIIYVDEPRISEGGRPVAHTHIVTIDRGDEATAALIEDLVTTLADFATDILSATSHDATRSLAEYEDGLEDEELDLGMGDSKGDV